MPRPGRQHPSHPPYTHPSIHRRAAYYSRLPTLDSLRCLLSHTQLSKYMPTPVQAGGRQVASPEWPPASTRHLAILSSHPPFLPSSHPPPSPLPAVPAPQLRCLSCLPPFLCRRFQRWQARESALAADKPTRPVRQHSRSRYASCGGSLLTRRVDQHKRMQLNPGATLAVTLFFFLSSPRPSPSRRRTSSCTRLGASARTCPHTCLPRPCQLEQPDLTAALTAANMLSSVARVAPSPQPLSSEQ